MSGRFDPDDEHEVTSLQKYEGRPHQPNRSGEKSAWNRFVTWVLPWLRRKRELADDFLEAEVLNKKADALTKIADAELKFAEARKTAAETAEIAARLEEAKFRHLGEVLGPDLERIGLPLAELESMRDEIDQKLEVLRAVYGGNVRLLEGHTEPSAASTEDSFPPATSPTGPDE